MDNTKKKRYKNDDILWYIAIFFVIFIIFIIAAGRWLNYKVLFQPKRKMMWTPDCDDYHDLYLEIDDYSGIAVNKKEKRNEKSYINVWYFDPYENEKVVLYCHGNNDNISYRNYVVDICKKFHLNLLLVDYRGYGRSDGKCCSKGIMNDVRSAYHFLENKYDIDDIIVWGESLGGSAAIRIAAEKPCHKLILLATFSSLEDIPKHMKFNKIVGRSLAAMAWLTLDSIPSKKYIQKVRCPIAIIHSIEDDIIPYRNGEILYGNIRHNKKLLISIKGKHSHPIFKKKDLYDIYNFAHTDSNFHPDTSDIENIISIVKNY